MITAWEMSRNTNRLVLGLGEGAGAGLILSTKSISGAAPEKLGEGDLQIRKISETLTIIKVSLRIKV